MKQQQLIPIFEQWPMDGVGWDGMGHPVTGAN